MEKQDAKHHPWCNRFVLPAEGCWQCKDLYERYPLREGETGSDIVHRYFPNALVRD